MLIWNGTEYVQFVGTRLIEPDKAGYPEYEECVSTEPLGGHDTVARVGPEFLKVLREFLEDPNSSYVDGTASYWRMRLATASGGAL